MRRLLFYTYILCSVSYSWSQNRAIDSLISLAQKESTHDTVKIKLFGDISWELMGSDINSALLYARKELELSERTGRKADIAQSESDVGSIYNRMSIFDTALIHYSKALTLREQLKHDEKVAGIYVNIASVYMRQNKFKEALDYDFKALKVFEKVGNKGKQATVLGNIGNVYYELEQNKPANEFFRRGLVLAREAKLAVIEGNILVNIGGLKFESAVVKDSLVDPLELDSALQYFLEAEVIMEKLNAQYNLAVVYNDIGRIYFTKRDFNRANQYYEKALKIREALSDKFGMGLSYLNIGEAYRLNGNYSKSIEYLEKSANIFLELRNFVSLKQSYGKLSMVYEAKKEYIKAMRYHELYAQYKDSVYSDENARQMAEMQTKYETEKKELENKELKDQNIIKELEIEKQKQSNFIKTVIIISVLVLFSLLLGLGLAVYKRKQLQQKAELAAEVARQKEIRTRSIIEAEEKERRRIAQDLHDGVGQILSAAKLNLSALESKIKLTAQDQKDAYKNALDLIDDSVKEVRAVSHNMMPNTLIKLGLASAIREFITKIGNVADLKVDLEIVGLDQRIDESIETVLYRVVQEIVNNIIKHAKANHISLQLIKHEKEITIMIEDNGVGFDTEKIHTFEGIGLKNIISRIEFLNGTVHFDSGKGRGTNVVIEVPA